MKNNTRKNGMDFSTVTEEVVSKISYLVIGRILLLLAIVLALFLTACKQDKPRGDVSVVDLEPGSSNIYSPEEIYAAMERVTEYFEEEFEGCVLTNLVYDEDYSMMRAAQWAEKYGDEEAIIFCPVLMWNRRGQTEV